MLWQQKLAITVYLNRIYPNFGILGQFFPSQLNLFPGRAIPVDSYVAC